MKFKPFQWKNIYFFKKKDFSVFFPFYFHILNENVGKRKKYNNFSWQFIFFSQNCINYPVSCISWRINILSKKDHLYFSSEKNKYMQFHEKSFFSRKKLIFWWFSAYFFLFIKQYTKITEYCHNILFSEKNIKWRVFQRFRSIIGILNKTLFYMYIICILNKEENSA